MITMMMYDDGGVAARVAATARVPAAPVSVECVTSAAVADAVDTF